MKSFLTAVGCVLFLYCEGQEILPRIGIAMNTASFPSAAVDLDVSFTQGFLTGIDFQVPITEQFGIMSELLFVQKGYRIEFDFDPAITNPPSYETLVQKIRVNYADLLCLPMYKLSNLYFMAGPGLSYGLFGNSYDALTDTNGQVTNRTSKIYFKEPEPGTPGDKYLDKRLVLTGVAGVGITLWELLLVDLRYQTSRTHYPYPSGVDIESKDWYHSLQLTTALRTRR